MNFCSSKFVCLQDIGATTDRKGKRKRKKSKKLLQAEGEEDDKEMVGSFPVSTLNRVRQFRIPVE